MTDGPPQRRQGRRALYATLLLWGVLAAGVVWLWSLDADRLHRQARVYLTAAAILVAGLGLVLASVRRPKVRARVWGGAFLAAVLFLALFEYRGLSGDLMPLFAPRWRSPATSLVRTASNDDAGPLVGVREYPGFQGAARDSVVPDIQLDPDWSTRPPRELWRRPIGKGWSSFAVADGRAWTQEQSGRQERLVCYELATGEPIWTLGYEASYASSIAGDGPRATPTVTDERVFAYGATGVLTAVERESGAQVWQHDVIARFGGTVPEWGASCSPLVHDGRVVVSAGGPGALLVAFAADTGELLWQSGDDAASYSSPMLADVGGSTQIVSFNAASITGHDRENGALLWSEPWSAKQVHVTQPLALPDGRLLVSAGYGHGSRAYRLSRSEGGAWSVEELWYNRRLKSKFSNWLLIGEHLYALDDGVFCCFDPEIGRRVWKEGRFGHGQMVHAGEHILLLAEDGELVLIEPSPDELRVLARHEVLNGKSWNAPALAGRYLLVRNEREARLWELPTR